MAKKHLVIVESPAKARTITPMLDKTYTVMASKGHVRDLPEKQFGIRTGNGFEPVYEVTPGRAKLIQSLVKEAKAAEDVYLATDPDREGEAIAWHLVEVLKEHVDDAQFHRVCFHEITRSAVSEAFEHARTLNDNLVNAQQARRVLDRLVGYKVSPLLWNRVKDATSAGRVQSVALRLICEREAEIRAFEPKEYWNFLATFGVGGEGAAFQAKLEKLDGKKLNVGDGETAAVLAEDAEKARYQVAKADKSPRKRRPSPPFITSTLQQAASTNLRFNPERTMRVAQQLYEGVEADPERGGLITYMRTDSVTVSKEAQEAARKFIDGQYGADYLPAKPNVYKSRKSAQEAHEAIRPTDVTVTPEAAAAFLEPDQAKLYRLIWSRFIASQMSPAQQLQYTIELENLPETAEHRYLFRATSTVVTFPGFLKAYNLREVESDTAEEQTLTLPELQAGMAAALKALEKEQKFTEPPPRYSQAMLVRELENNGIGRPSTYASIIDTIRRRTYVSTEKGRLTPTELGINTNDYLSKTLPDLLQVDFTARMEDELDSVERGEIGWQAMLEKFYESFNKWLYDAKFAGGPEVGTAQRVLALFPETVEWAPPTKLGRKTYDDKKFFNSLKEQVEKGNKLSDKQWQALLRLAVTYEAQLDGLKQAEEELGLTEDLEALRERLQVSSQDTVAVDEKALRLCNALASVKEWEPPRKDGRRTYDDEKFAKSLTEQLQAGRRLSDAQMRALRNLATKYGAQIADFDALKAEFALEQPAPVSEESKEAAATMLKMMEEVTEWAKPTTRGRRKYSDESFCKSLSDQFGRKNALSDKQLAALRKVALKYKDQIADFDARMATVKLPEAVAPKPTGVTCPKCEAGELVERKGRGAAFYGCNNYPKCRYRSKSLEPLDPVG